MKKTESLMMAVWRVAERNDKKIIVAFLAMIILATLAFWQGFKHGVIPRIVNWIGI